MKTPLVAPLIPITPNKYETPMTTIVRAFDELLLSNKSGQVVEASGPNLYYTKQQAYPDEIAKWVWDDGPGFWAGEMAKLGSN
jgi:15-hydroxyprostaglandin dehydrogenase (NAD)